MPPRVSLLLVLVVVLALAGIAWVMLSGRDARDAGLADLVDRTPSETPAAPLRQAPAGEPALEGSKRGRDAWRRRPRWPVIPSDRIPRGTLHVLPLDANEKPLPATEVSVRLEREGAEFSAPPIGQPDYDAGVWTFEKVTIGWVRVIVFGDHLVETTARAEVRAGREAEVKVVVQPGGALHYKALLYSGEAPEEVTLSLLARGTKRPQAVYWQVRLPTSHNSAHKATSAKQGPDGYAFAVPPGAFTLRAESPEGEIDLVDVDVRAGETQDVDILLRK